MNPLMMMMMMMIEYIKIECVFNYILTYARKRAKLDTNIVMTLYQNQSKWVMKVMLPYYGTHSAN